MTFETKLEYVGGVQDGQSVGAVAHRVVDVAVVDALK